MTMKILFLHGWNSVPGGVKPTYLATRGHAVRDGSRLLSSYRTLRGVVLWLVTEAVGDDGERASTCATTPDEY